MSEADAELRAALTEKAQELFTICDVEKNGFITKRDMQRLCGHMPLPPEHVEAVFEKLDSDGNGYLTLEEFTGGFGTFVGVPIAPEPTSAEPTDAAMAEEASRLRAGFQPNRRRGTIGEYNPEEDEHFKQTLTKLGASGVFQDEENVKELWSSLQMEHPELVPGLESLLAKMSDEIRKSHDSCKNMEKVLRTKTTAHDEEVRRLYEEMEAQIRSERARVLAEERAKEKQLREEMEREIREKGKLCDELLKNHEALERRLGQLNQVQAETAQENERLGRERDVLEDKLQDSRGALEESRAYVDDLQRKFKEDRRRRAQAAIQLTEGIALEREGLVRQLDSLRDANRRLKDASDIAGGQDWAGSGSGEIIHVHDGGEDTEHSRQQESLQGLLSAGAVVAG